jgi:hypothetical protein
MWPLLLLIPILARCGGAQPKENDQLKEVNELDDNFVRHWNMSASDGMINPDEFHRAEQLAQQTMGKGDDTFMGNLRQLTESPVRSLEEVLQQQEQFDSLKKSAAKFGLNIYNLEIFLSNTTRDTRIIETGANIPDYLTGKIQVRRQ